MEFMIVRKDGSMKTVGQDCDGMEKIATTRTEVEENSVEGERKIKRVFSVFQRD